jgi:hypothetical protein
MVSLHNPLYSDYGLTTIMASGKGPILDLLANCTLDREVTEKELAHVCGYGCDLHNQSGHTLEINPSGIIRHVTQRGVTTYSVDITHGKKTRGSGDTAWSRMEVQSVTITMSSLQSVILSNVKTEILKNFNAMLVAFEIVNTQGVRVNVVLSR